MFSTIRPVTLTSYVTRHVTVHFRHVTLRYVTLSHCSSLSLPSQHCSMLTDTADWMADWIGGCSMIDKAVCACPSVSVVVVAVALVVAAAAGTKTKTTPATVQAVSSTKRENKTLGGGCNERKTVWGSIRWSSDLDWDRCCSPPLPLSQPLPPLEPSGFTQLHSTQRNSTPPYLLCDRLSRTVSVLSPSRLLIPFLLVFFYCSSVFLPSLSRGHDRIGQGYTFFFPHLPPLPPSVLYSFLLFDMLPIRRSSSFLIGPLDLELVCRSLFLYNSCCCCCCCCCGRDITSHHITSTPRSQTLWLVSTTTTNLQLHKHKHTMTPHKI